MLKPLLWLLFGLQAATTGTIEVFVHVAGTTTPVSDVEVSLNTVTKQKTDEIGRAVFSDLPSGVYRVRAERTGYFRKDESISSLYSLPSSLVARMATSATDSLTISVSPPNWSQRISIGMVEFGSISGRVTDKDGLPLKDVSVSAGSIQYQNGRRILDEWTRTMTNGDGEYSITSLGPGEYYVRADRQGRSYTGTYYPGEIDVMRATWIHVGSGDKISGIDFTPTNLKTFSVSGKVINLPKRTQPDGKTVDAPAVFGLIPHDLGTPDFPFPVQLANEHSGGDGNFLIKGVPVGSWDLVSIVTNDIRSLSEPRRVVGRTQIAVVNEDIKDVVIDINSYAVTGRTRMTGGEPVPIALRAMLIPRDNTPFNFVAHLTRAKTLGFLDGSFVFQPVPPGKYSFQFEELPAGYYLADIRHGGRSISEDGVIEIFNQSPEPFEVVIGRGGGQVTGKVEGLPEGLKLQEYSSARVVLVPAKRRNLMLYQVAALSEDGYFSFSYVAPGEYKVFALKNLPDGAEKSSEFLSRYEALGTSVTVSTGSSRDLLVPMVRND